MTRGFSVPTVRNYCFSCAEVKYDPVYYFKHYVPFDPKTADPSDLTSVSQLH